MKQLKCLVALLLVMMLAAGSIHMPAFAYGSAENTIEAEAEDYQTDENDEDPKGDDGTQYNTDDYDEYEIDENTEETLDYETSNQTEEDNRDPQDKGSIPNDSDYTPDEDDEDTQDASEYPESEDDYDDAQLNIDDCDIAKYQTAGTSAFPPTIVPHGPGSQLVAADFTQFDVGLYWGGVPVGLTGANFRNGQYTLSMDFAFQNGTVINAGDYFEIDMTISGANFTTPSGTIVLGGGDLSVEITNNGSDLTVRVIFNNNLTDTNISGRANINIAIVIPEPGPVYWEVGGTLGSPGGGSWGGTGTPPTGPQPGFNNNGPGANKGVVHAHRDMGLFEWQVGINNNGSPAWNFFSHHGFTTLPQYVRITDTLSGPHTLVPWSNALSDINASSDRIIGGHVVLVAVNLEEVWRLFNDAALDPAVEAELRLVPWLALPGDMSIYDPIQRDVNGGFYMDTFIVGAANNRLRWNNNYFQSRPFIVENYPNLVRTLDIPLNLTVDGFYIDVPTAFFDNAAVFMRYQTRVLPGADPGDVLANSIRISGDGDDSFTRVGTTVWDGWSGVNQHPYQIEILKQDPNNANANMAGATFSIERQNTPFTAAQGANAQGIVQITTNSQGIASTLLGLGAFTPNEVFIIREVTPPSGYQLYTGDIRISLDPYNGGAVTLLNGRPGAPFSLDAETGQLVLNNNPIPPSDIDVTVRKGWADSNDAAGFRPAFITVQLLADGVAHGGVVTLSAPVWSHTFTGLQRYSAPGIRVVYSVVEVNVPTGYTPTIGAADIDGETGNVTIAITNTFTMPQTQVTVNKSWNDNTDAEGFRPESIEIQLYADGVAHGNVVTLAVPAWSHTFTGLQRYSAPGVRVVYSVVEVNVPAGYTPSIGTAVINTDTGNVTISVTNTFAMPETSVTVNKGWLDNDNDENFRPTSIQIQLYANGVAHGNIVTLSAPAWSHTFTALQRYSAPGVRIVYTVEEVNVPAGYTEIIGSPVVDNDGNVTIEIVNNFGLPVTEVTVNKAWVNDDAAGFRPSSITVQLYADGTPRGGLVSLYAANEWTHTFIGLPRYSAPGIRIVYTIVEVNVPTGYTPSIGTPVVNDTTGNVSIAVTNTFTMPQTELTVNKSWDDNDDAEGFRPLSISIQLLADGVAHGGLVTLSAPTWSYTFTDLQRYSAPGVRVVYSVVEVNVPTGYAPSIGTAVVNTDTGNVSIAVTNTFTMPETEVTINKGWLDNEDAESFRPASIQIRLYADGVAHGEIVTLSAPTWSYTFTGLQRYSEPNVRIVYEVEEVNVPTGYTEIIGTPVVDNDGNVTIEIVNNFGMPVTEVTVNKAWVDSDDAAGLRTDFIMVQLYADGVRHGELVTIYEANGWTHTFIGLPRYSAPDVRIVYTVVEVNVPFGYTPSLSTTIEASGNVVIIITNTLAPGHGGGGGSGGSGSGGGSGLPGTPPIGRVPQQPGVYAPTTSAPADAQQILAITPIVYGLTEVEPQATIVAVHGEQAEQNDSEATAIEARANPQTSDNVSLLGLILSVMGLIASLGAVLPVQVKKKNAA